jgi:hypothetical protein
MTAKTLAHLHYQIIQKGMNINCMVPTKSACSLCGPYLVPTWSLRGPYVVYTFLVPTGSLPALPGPYMVLVCQVPVRSLPGHYVFPTLAF